MGRWIITLALLVGCFVLTEWLPFSPYFRNMDTMIHEFGHAAATLLLSGEVQYIHLYEDHSGVTLFAVLLFALHRYRQYRVGLAIVTGIALVCLLLFVRNDFGSQWLLGFIGLNALAFIMPIAFVRMAYYMLLAFLSLVESVTGAATILYLAATKPEGAGDAANLAGVTGVPAILWGVFFLLFALWCAKRAILYFLPPPKKSMWSKKRGVSPLT